MNSIHVRRSWKSEWFESGILLGCMRVRQPISIARRANFRSRITVRNITRRSSVELPVSLLNLLQLGASQGHQVLIRAEGEDET